MQTIQKVLTTPRLLSISSMYVIECKCSISAFTPLTSQLFAFLGWAAVPQSGPLPPPAGQSAADPALQRTADPLQRTADPRLRRYWDEDSLVSPLTRSQRAARPGHSLPASQHSHLLPGARAVHTGANSFSLGEKKNNICSAIYE